MNHLLYIDPGSGSYFVQVVAGGILTALYFLRGKIRSIFTTKKKGGPDKNPGRPTN